MNEVGPSDYNLAPLASLMTCKGGNSTVPLSRGMKLRVTVEEFLPTAPPTKGSSSDAVGSSGEMNKMVLAICIAFAGLMGFTVN